MDEFVEMLVKAKNGDLKSKEELLNMYRPLLCKEGKCTIITRLESRPTM